MAISHNLSNIADNLSGFDPVDGESDGTTIGRNYLLWQVFKGLEAFDSNVVMISSSGATPSWLASESGTIMTEPAKNAGVVNQTIKFFMLNDAGLSGSIPSAYIHEWGTTNDFATNNNLISVNLRYKVSGSATYSPINSGSIVENDNGSTISNVINCMTAVSYSVATTTVMNNIPKIVYWKSENAHMVMSIAKVTGLYRGYLMWYTPHFTGSTEAEDIEQGENFNCITFNNANTGMTWMEPFSQTYETSLTALPTNLSRITSAGIMPTIPYVIGGNDSYLVSKLNLGATNLVSFKAVSDEIEGVYLTDSTLIPNAAGTILNINSKYYITGNTLNDGRTAYKILVQLSP